MIARNPALLLIVAAMLLLAAGCGGDDTSGSADSTGSKVTEEPADTTGASDDAAGSASGDGLKLGVVGNELKFDTTELTAPAGSVTISLDNTSAIVHNIAIEDKDGNEIAAGELVGDGETSTITTDLKPGTYSYYCQPHKSSGMTGTLVVS